MFGVIVCFGIHMYWKEMKPSLSLISIYVKQVKWKITYDHEPCKIITENRFLAFFHFGQFSGLLGESLWIKEALLGYGLFSITSIQNCYKIYGCAKSFVKVTKLRSMTYDRNYPVSMKITSFYKTTGFFSKYWSRLDIRNQLLSVWCLQFFQQNPFLYLSLSFNWKSVTECFSSWYYVSSC